MPRTKRASGTDEGLSKFQRYCRTKQRKGLKLLRIWAPDPHTPKFAREAERQGKLLRGRAEEKQAMAFIDAVVEWPEP